MKKTIMVLLMCLTLHTAFAQKITLSFNGVSMSKALETISGMSSEYSIMFLYDELEDFTVTTHIVKQNVPDAIRQIIGFYPIKMTIDGKNIYVECIQKTKQKLIGKVVDQKGQPLEFANVTLLNPSDSSFITGGASNASGDFVVPCENKVVLAKFTYVGYKTIIKRMNVENVGKIAMFKDPQYIGEVTIEGSRVINLADRQLLIPTKEVVKHSSDGYQLLKKMNINGLIVDPVLRSVRSLSGGSVQIRVNDIKATSADLLSLQPDEVVRVENILNPGVKYSENGLDNVINFVVRRRYSGYVAGISGHQAVAVGFNNTQAYFKYNYKLSEFSLDYGFSYRDYNKRRYDDHATYLFPDGTSRSRNYIGQNTGFMYNTHDVQLGYSLSNPDKYVLNARLLLSAWLCPRRGNNQIAEESGKPDLYLYNKIKANEITPSFDIYYSVNMPKNQELDINIVGTNIKTDHHYMMQQYLYKGNAEESMSSPAMEDYSYSTDGRKYSLIGEAIYKKRFDKLSFSGGMYYDLGYANNKYTGSNNLDAQLHTSNYYAFAQIEGTLKKINYQLGVGTKRVYAHQGDLGYSKWTFRPQLSLSTNIMKNVSVNYSFNIFPNTPSLADLTSVRQQHNDLMCDVGNSGLKPYNKFTNKLGISWNNKYVQLNARYSYSTAPDIIMESYIPQQQTDGSYLIVTQYLNQKNYKKHTFQFFGNVNIIPDVLTFSPFGMYENAHSMGLDYSHKFAHWTWGASADLMLGNWDVSYQFTTQPKSFMGETMTGGERSSDFEADYKWKNLQIGVGCILLGYAQGFDYKSVTKSKYYQSDAPVYIKDNGNMVYLTFSYNLSHGRKYQTSKRVLENSDNENGIK
ncbi:MAG: TonB-dependent receptor family protein [Prevotella sp.]|jgi:hypothetical protein|nr:TonB-dependent receptor family protein [Prevotella sp.]MCI1282404.1 TonB-dependent receptor family protein [Prevotella sp.]